MSIEKIWLDVGAFILALTSFILSLFTRRSDRRWKADVEMRRPFNAELQKLTMLIAQNEGVLARFKWQVQTVGWRLEAIEKSAKPHPALQELKAVRAQMEETLAAVNESSKLTKNRMQQWWSVRKPSGSDIAELQRASAEHAALVQRLQNAEDRAKNVFQLAFSIDSEHRPATPSV
jgi:uncharacterized protein YqiB (DUF1249 family)